MQEKQMSQSAFTAWLTSKGITITAQYLSDVLKGRRHPGPKLKAVFKEITGITLVEGLVEDTSRRAKP